MDPKTVTEAVDLLCEKLSKGDKKELASLPEGRLTAATHRGLGTWIRNNFGLWTGNDELMRATGEVHPDSASSVIIKELWQKLRRS